MRNMLRRFVHEVSGATAIEYGLIAGFISLGIITAAQNIGAEIITIFSDVAAGFR